MNPSLQKVSSTIESTLQTVAMQPSILSNMSLSNLVQNINMTQQNALANQQAMNQVGITVVGKMVNLIANLSPVEAAAAKLFLTENDLAAQLTELEHRVVG